VSQHLSKTKAEQCLAAVRVQFAAYLGDGAPEPRLFEPGFHSDGWTIGWEEGPHEWSLRAFVGGFDDETYGLAVDAGLEAGLAPEQALANARTVAQLPEHPRPVGVFTEPLNHWALCLYRED